VCLHPLALDGDGNPPLVESTQPTFSAARADAMSEVTRILSAIEQGDPHAAGQLLPLVYEELRKLAAGYMANEAPGQTLDATALVHEAYLRLVGPTGCRDFANRCHFFAAAAEAMRRILVESARRKRGPKQGGDRQRLEADLDAISTPGPSVDLLALDEALTRLAQEMPLRAELVKLRFFAGLTMPEAAQALGISLATAERYWTYARTWLYAELSDSAPPPSAEKSGTP
jgi:RNA polymerase sigma factor (TIGR02999 family)